MTTQHAGVDLVADGSAKCDRTSTSFDHAHVAVAVKVHDREYEDVYDHGEPIAARNGVGPLFRSVDRFAVDRFARSR